MHDKIGAAVAYGFGVVIERTPTPAEYQKQQDLLMGKNQVIVELTGQPDGFYFVTITDAQNRKETRKIVKSKN